jgi:hypothetical protein
MNSILKNYFKFAKNAITLHINMQYPNCTFISCNGQVGGACIIRLTSVGILFCTATRDECYKICY